VIITEALSSCQFSPHLLAAAASFTLSGAGVVLSLSLLLHTSAKLLLLLLLLLLLKGAVSSTADVTQKVDGLAADALTADVTSWGAAGMVLGSGSAVGMPASREGGALGMHFTACLVPGWLTAAAAAAAAVLLLLLLLLG
jgi:hypothetical protein